MAPRRVIVLGLDGLDPRAVDLLMSEGKLPNFARMRQEGAYGRLLSAKPLVSPVLWTTIATGRPPADHGIGPFVAESNATGSPFPVTSEMRRVKSIWNILSELGKKVAVVGWWATWPAEPVHGVIVSDHAGYPFLLPPAVNGARSRAGVTYPEDRLSKLDPLVARPDDMSLEEVSPFIEVGKEELLRDFDLDDDVSRFKWALANAKSYERIGLQLWREERPDLLMVYIEATNTVAYLFGHLFRAGELQGELAEQRRKFGNAVEQMYLYADRLVGKYMEAMDEDTTLVVVSDHGFELGLSHEDPSKARDPRRESESFHRNEGILYLYGNRVRRNARIEQATLLDIAPTLLELSAQAAARDMPGGVLAEALVAYTPGELVATYESAPAGPSSPAGDFRPYPASGDRLRSLGYLGASDSSSSDRNQAALYFEAGRYEESVRIYQELIEASPGDVSLRTSLSGALGAMGRFDEAMGQIEMSIALAPLNVEAYHNRAVIHEKRGNRDAAVADYRRALLYEPSYEPSRRALMRLTGSAEARTARDENERRAWSVAAEAAQAARQGNYPRAMALLDRAEEIAPGSVVIHQFRSNVAYLMGDIDTAVDALEKALELEPENALFKANLMRLRDPAAR
jgi:predicted AlkP superfamily phosphohydrolase/phosphomutase/Flp pilus assembly protein TadD